jgi:hypothetical protein
MVVVVRTVHTVRFPTESPHDEYGMERRDQQ